jgi:hypothetical protein
MDARVKPGHDEDDFARRGRSTGENASKPNTAVDNVMTPA